MFVNHSGGGAYVEMGIDRVTSDKMEAKRSGRRGGVVLDG